jgi:hypothetical protein
MKLDRHGPRVEPPRFVERGPRTTLRAGLALLRGMLRFSTRVLPIALFLLLLTARPTRANDDVRPDVLMCEEAVAHLASCCPQFEAGRLHCEFGDEGCGDVKLAPVFSEDDSQCIVATTCAGLVADGVCARAQEATNGRVECSSPRGSCDTPSSRVCP